MFRSVHFQFRAGAYRFVRDSCIGPRVGEYLLIVEASGVVNARDRTLYMGVKS
jgi:hypothetical protein